MSKEESGWEDIITAFIVIILVVGSFYYFSYNSSEEIIAQKSNQESNQKQSVQEETIISNSEKKKLAEEELEKKKQAFIKNIQKEEKEKQEAIAEVSPRVNDIQVLFNKCMNDISIALNTLPYIKDQGTLYFHDGNVNACLKAFPGNANSVIMLIEENKDRLSENYINNVHSSFGYWWSNIQYNSKVYLEISNQKHWSIHGQYVSGQQATMLNGLLDGVQYCPSALNSFSDGLDCFNALNVVIQKYQENQIIPFI